MSKHAFKYFAGCAFVIIGIGIFLEIKRKTIVFNGDGPGLVTGWQVMLIGGFMMLLGFILKWIAKKEDKHFIESKKTPRVLTEDDWIADQGPGG